MIARSLRSPWRPPRVVSLVAVVASASACARTPAKDAAQPSPAMAIAPSAVAPPTAASAPPTEGHPLHGLFERLRRQGRARIVLVGDTGFPGSAQRAVAAAVRAERKDLVIALGDLVYPTGPRCPKGELFGLDRRLFEARFHEILGRLGAPVLVALGNHDVGHVPRSPAREACYFAYARAHPTTYYFPELSYAVDLGFASLGILNTNALTPEQGQAMARAQGAHAGWRLLFGHHAWRVYYDKLGEDRVRPWAMRHRLRPHLFANGHAHLLQLGFYDGVLAVTSGAGALLRERPACPPRCGEGELWGRSVQGYAVLELTAARLVVELKDQRGETLHTHALER